MRIFITIFLITAGFASVATTIGGISSTQSLNTQYTFTYDAGAAVAGGVYWTLSGGGTVVSTYNPSRFSTTTEHSAVISFQSYGSWGIIAKNYAGTVLATKTVTVNYPTLVPGSIGADQTVCSGQTPSLLTSTGSPSGGSGSYSYQWQSLIRFGSWTNISGATSSSYQPGSGQRDYRRRVISGGQTKYSNTVKVTTVGLIAGSIGNAQTLCYNGNPSTLSNTASASGGIGTIYYQWQVSSNGSSFSNISGATGTTYNPGALTSSRWYRRRATVCGLTAYTNTIKVTIYANPGAGSIGNAQTVCYNGNPSTLSNTSSATGGNGSYTYQWQYRSPGGSWSNLSGATATTYNPPALTSTKEYRRRVYTCGVYKYTNTIIVTVRATLNPGSVGNLQTICYNYDPAPFTNTASPSGGNGSYAYQWQYYTGSTWSNISGATGITYDAPPLTSQRSYRRRVISCGETKYTNGVKILVVADLTPGSINNAQTLCYNGNPTTLTSTADASGGSTAKAYQWQNRSPGGTWANITTSGTGTTYDPPALTATKEYRRRVIACETEYTNTITVTIYPILNAGSIGGIQTVCYNGAAALTNASSASGGNGSISYRWKSRLPGGTWSNVSGATSSTLTTANLITTTEFKRKATSCGQTFSTNSVTVTVRPTLNPGSIGGSAGGELQVICSGDDPTTLTNTSSPSGGNGTYAYQWQYYTGSTWASISGATFLTYDPPALTATRNHRRKVTSCGQSLYTNTAKIIVIDYPDAPIVTAPASVNPGTSVTFTAQDVDDQWYTASTGGTAFYAGSSYIETLSTNTTYYVSAMNGACESTTRTSVTTTVNLIAGDITTTPATICYQCIGAPITPAAPQGSIGSYTYQWQKFDTGLNDYVDVTGATGASHSPFKPAVNTTYRRRVQSGSATAYSNTVVQAVYPILNPKTIAADQSLCDNVMPAAFTGAAATGGDNSYVYQWENANTATGPWTAVSGATLATYTAPSAITQDTWYKRTVTSVGQTKETNVVKLTYVPPSVPGIVKGTDFFCGSGTLDLSYLGGATNPVWEVKAPGGSWLPYPDIVNGGQLSATVSIIEPALNGAKYRVTGGSTCGTIISSEKTITVQSLYTGILNGPAQTFYGTATTTVSLSGNAGTITRWEESVDNGVSWSNIANTTSSMNLTNENQTKMFRVLLDFPGCSTGYTANYTVQVAAAGFAGYVTGPTETTGAINSGTLTLQSGITGATRWYSSTTGSGSNWGASVASTATYSFQNLLADTFFKAERDDANGQTFTSDIHVVQVLPDITTDIAKDNYVKSISLLTEETQLANIPSLAADDTITSYTYMDGRGRGIQSVIKAASPTGQDIVSFQTFDPQGIVSRSYLPFTSTGSDYYTDPAALQLSYYQAGPTGIEASSYPFAETEREASPRKLVLEQGAPGADWQLGGGNTVTHTYRFNTVADAVTKFDVDDLTPTGTSTYPKNSLNRRETTDENGNKVVVYTDARGRTVLKKVEQQAGVYASTANVYDIMGRLRCTFPPEAMAHVAANATTWTLTNLRDNLDLIFEYTYDGEGRLKERKVPGKGLEYIVYDPYERVALTQDAIMRVNNQWAFTKYDKLGRVVYSGLYTDASTRAQLQTSYDALDYDTTDPYYETRGTTLEGYTNTVYPILNLEVLAVNYYDDYDFDRDSSPDYPFDPNHMGGQNTWTLSNTRFLATGSKTKILESTNDWLIGVSFYDDDGRVLQSQGNNHKNLTVEDKATMRYADFTGELLESKSSIKVGTETTEVQKLYTYDTHKRLLKTEHNLNSGGWVTLNEVTYNELGQVIEKNIGESPLPGTAPLQSIDYAYNIRGWLTSINNSQLSIGTDPVQDVFGEELFYNASAGGLNTVAYNGNISAIKWSSYEPEGSGITERGYSYSYDKADRLTNAGHFTKNGGWSTSNAFDLSGVQYDANGNLTNLTRTDDANATADALSYTYIGNQLQTVGDTGNTGGFVDGNTTGDDYAYDVNGNVVKDLNKGIDSIYYNHLDLPTTVILNASEGSADSLTYTYDAGGSKLQMKIWKDGVVQTTTDYIGGMRYENDTLRTIAHDEGRIVNPSASGGPDYQYILSDHQGNTRRVLSSLPEIYTTTEDFEDGSSSFSDLHLFTRDTANSTLPLALNDGVSLLQAGTTGALVLLRMDKGDTVDLQVKANYEGAPTGNTFASTLYTALFTSWDTSFGSGAETGGISGTNTAFNDALTGADMTGKNGSNTAPRAFLNYIFFDLNMNYAEQAGFKQITTAALGVAVHETVQLNDIIADQSGYLLAYLSNENTEAVNIHFDDFTVTHSKTNVVQAIDYYPFGAVASSYTRTAADPTKYLYNAGAELNDITGYYETFFRNYDATIGRFNGVDVMAGKYSSMSPYVYAMNDPIYWNDPLGDDVLYDDFDCDICQQDNSTFIERWGAGGMGGALGSRYGSSGLADGQSFDSWIMQNAYESRIQADFDNSMEAIRAFVGAFTYMEVFMSQVYSNGDVIDMGGDFRVYEDPAMMAAVLNYYINKLPNLQSFYANKGGWIDDGLLSGSVVVGTGASNAIQARRGHPVDQVNADGLGQSARGAKPNARGWKGFAEAVSKFFGYAKPDITAVPTPTEITEVEARIDSFLSLTPNLKLTPNGLMEVTKGFVVDGSDSTFIQQFPSGNIYEYIPRYDENFPKNVTKINKKTD